MKMFGERGEKSSQVWLQRKASDGRVVRKVRREKLPCNPASFAQSSQDGSPSTGAAENKQVGTGRPLEPHRLVAKTGINKECFRPKRRYGLKREGGWADLVGSG